MACGTKFKYEGKMANETKPMFRKKKKNETLSGVKVNCLTQFTINLPFKTKQSSVAQSVLKWERFEEKLSVNKNWIQRFSVEIIKWQPT